MIKLNKAPCPDVLRDNCEAWTENFLDKLLRGEKPTESESSRYRHPKIKKALTAETHGKCAYCESKFGHVHHGDVEHIFPKSLDETKRFLWDNLTLACEICNQNKSNKDPRVEHIIDPYQDDPEQYLCFVGPMVFDSGLQKGASTIRLLDLNRIDLLEMRNQKIQSIMKLYQEMMRPECPVVVRDLIINDLKNKDASDEAEYAAAVRALIRYMDSYFAVLDR